MASLTPESVEKIFQMAKWDLLSARMDIKENEECVMNHKRLIRVEEKILEHFAEHKQQQYRFHLRINGASVTEHEDELRKHQQKIDLHQHVIHELKAIESQWENCVTNWKACKQSEAFKSYFDTKRDDFIEKEWKLAQKKMMWKFAQRRVKEMMEKEAMGGEEANSEGAD